MQRKFHSSGHPDTPPLSVLYLAGVEPAAIFCLYFPFIGITQSILKPSTRHILELTEIKDTDSILDSTDGFNGGTGRAGSQTGVSFLF